MTVRASIIIPTHNRAESLRLAVRSVLAQSVAELEVLIVGDGVTDRVRSEALALVVADPRVRFFDREKGPHHGEIYRHNAVMDACSDAIFYLCDDDLLLKDHVADLLDMLEHHNFVQSLNGWIKPSGAMDFYAADLSRPETILWHLRDDIRFNAVGITGTAHSRDFYLQVEDPWSTTPAGQWPDHHQWRKFFRHPNLSAATSARMTALQFPTTKDGRDTWTEAERLTELLGWANVAAAPDAQERIDALVAVSMWSRIERDSQRVAGLHLEITGFGQEIASLGQEVAESHLEIARFGQENASLGQEVAELHLEIARVRQENADLRQENASLSDVAQLATTQAEQSRTLLAETRRTLSWRITKPLRAVRRLMLR